jgi:hypothetical protein
MMKMLMIVLISLVCSGCASSLDKAFTVKVMCEDCVTPWGRGEKVAIEINRTVAINKEKK